MNEYDVIIVGAGPAGSAAAIQIANLAPALARRTLLLEKGKFPRHKLCGGGVTRHADALLAKLRIQPDVPSYPIHAIRLVFKDLRFTFRWRNLFRVVRREEFDTALAHSACERGADLHEGEELIDFRNDTRGVRVETNLGAYQTKILVGADGANSRVRQRLGLVRWDRISRLLEVLTPADPRSAPEFADHVAVFDFSPVTQGVQGYYWDFPSLKNGVPMMNRGLFDSRVSASRPRAPLKTIFQHLLAERHVDWQQVHLQGHPERWYDHSARHSAYRVMLAGDAAGTEPLLGEGISHALDFGMRAAAATVEALRRDTFDFKDYEWQIARSALGRRLQLKRRVARLAYANLSRRFYPLGFQLMRLILGE